MARAQPTGAQRLLSSLGRALRPQTVLEQAVYCDELGRSVSVVYDHRVTAEYNREGQKCSKWDYKYQDSTFAWVWARGYEKRWI